MYEEKKAPASGGGVEDNKNFDPPNIHMSKAHSKADDSRASFASRSVAEEKEGPPRAERLRRARFENNRARKLGRFKAAGQATPLNQLLVDTFVSGGGGGGFISRGGATKGWEGLVPRRVKFRLESSMRESGQALVGIYHYKSSCELFHVRVAECSCTVLQGVKRKAF